MTKEAKIYKVIHFEVKIDGYVDFLAVLSNMFVTYVSRAELNYYINLTGDSFRNEKMTCSRLHTIFPSFQIY